MIPYKRKKGEVLTPEQKAHNHRVNSMRVTVEHIIGRLKRHARLRNPYDGTNVQFDEEFDVIT